MGTTLTCFENTPLGYKSYIFFITNLYGNVAEHVINDLYERIAEDLGSDRILVKFLGKAIVDAEEFFKVENLKKPVLVITDIHPDKIFELRELGLEPEQDPNYIVISLGTMNDENSIKNFVAEIVRFVNSEEYSRINSIRRVEWIKNKIEYFRIVDAIASVLSIIF